MAPADVVLHLWEVGQRCGPADRVLAMLASALPDRDREALAAFDLAVSDWHLLRLRQALFGSTLAGSTECPDCGERLEIEFDAGATGECPPPPLPYTSGAGRRFRLPTVGDLLAVATMDASDAAARRLFERCSLDAGTAIEAMPDFDEVDAGLAALAAERACHLDVTCAACGKVSRHALDPAEFLWTEIAACAAGLLDQVHELASAYGWSERDILAMSAVRRAAYLRRAG